MKAIRLVNGHFDGTRESCPAEPKQQVHKRLPQGDWVQCSSGAPKTHDVYGLSVNEQNERVYTCQDPAIEKTTWLKLQKIREAAKG